MIRNIRVKLNTNKFGSTEFEPSEDNKNYKCINKQCKGTISIIFETDSNLCSQTLRVFRYRLSFIEHYGVLGIVYKRLQ